VVVLLKHFLDYRGEAQIALVLNILCGFSVNEIANALVSSRSAIEKRVTRAKKVLAGSKTLAAERRSTGNRNETGPECRVYSMDTVN
jgi:predicted DNA-binding protein YlxM (UPF0122 family)